MNNVRKGQKKARKPVGRGGNGTRGPMQGTLPDNLKIIKEIQIKRFLKTYYIYLRLVTWTVSHRGTDASQVTEKKCESLREKTERIMLKFERAVARGRLAACN